MKNSIGGFCFLFIVLCTRFVSFLTRAFFSHSGVSARTEAVPQCPQALVLYPIVSISHIIKNASEIMPIVTIIGTNISFTVFQ